MTVLRIYPEKNIAYVITDADESTDRLFQTIADEPKESDGEYTYVRMKLDTFMNNIRKLDTTV